ncbi:MULTISPECIES: DUF397 domain-containing protein [unclassified Kitasatospora]|uniref:DUF397 domain-containing protein n=1 Tax=unclassified Kitasatospora TaxID=2633591 RepID=UPI00337E2056
MAVPEIAVRDWFKSSFSAQANDCVETRRLVLGGMAVRDSKDSSGLALAFTADAWTAFVRGVKAGELSDG